MHSKDVVWVAQVFPDWTVLEVKATGDMFGFCRETGKVLKLPHNDCPIIPIPKAWAKAADELARDPRLSRKTNANQL